MRISVLAFCTALFFLILAHYAQASSLKEKIKENRNLLQKAHFQEKYILKELNDIAKQIENLSLAITEIQNKIKNTKENLTTIHIKIEKLKQKEQQLKKQYIQRNWHINYHFKNYMDEFTIQSARYK